MKDTEMDNQTQEHINMVDDHNNHDYVDDSSSMVDMMEVDDPIVSAASSRAPISISELPTPAVDYCPEIARHRETVHYLNRVNSSYAKSKKELQLKVTERDDKIAALELQLSKFTQSLFVSSSQLEEEKLKNASLQSQLSSLQQTNSQLLTFQNESIHKFTTLESQLLFLKQSNSKMKMSFDHQIRSYVANIELLQDENMKEKNTINNLELLNHKLIHANQQFQQTNVILQGQLDMIRGVVQMTGNRG